MMIHAYAETYLNDAMDHLGDMMDYAVYDCAYTADSFFSLFITSGVAAAFEIGNPKYVAGMSGPELASEVVFQTFGSRLLTKPSVNVEKTPEYWIGWSLAYYQWFMKERFERLMQRGLTMNKLISFYPILHEADISKFVDIVQSVILQDKNKKETNLCRLRKARGLSQKQLAEQSGVSLRMIQLYEQRQNNINKAQVVALQNVAQIIGCKIDDLLE